MAGQPHQKLSSGNWTSEGEHLRQPSPQGLPESSWAPSMMQLKSANNSDSFVLFPQLIFVSCSLSAPLSHLFQGLGRHTHHLHGSIDFNQNSGGEKVIFTPKTKIDISWSRIPNSQKFFKFKKKGPNQCHTLAEPHQTLLPPRIRGWGGG